MSVGANVYSILHGFSAVVNIVATRIYPGTIPQAAIVPAIVYNVIAGMPENVMNGAPAGDHELIQIDAWALDYDTATTLRDAIRAAFEAQSTTTIGCKVVAFYPDNYEPDTKRYSRSIGLSVWSQR